MALLLALPNPPPLPPSKIPLYHYIPCCFWRGKVFTCLTIDPWYFVSYTVALSVLELRDCYISLPNLLHWLPKFVLPGKSYLIPPLSLSGDSSENPLWLPWEVLQAVSHCVHVVTRGLLEGYAYSNLFLWRTLHLTSHWKWGSVQLRNGAITLWSGHAMHAYRILLHRSVSAINKSCFLRLQIWWEFYSKSSDWWRVGDIWAIPMAFYIKLLIPLWDSLLQKLWRDWY